MTRASKKGMIVPLVEARITYASGTPCVFNKRRGKTKARQVTHIQSTTCQARRNLTDSLQRVLVN